MGYGLVSIESRVSGKPQTKLHTNETPHHKPIYGPDNSIAELVMSQEGN